LWQGRVVGKSLDHHKHLPGANTRKRDICMSCINSKTLGLTVDLSGVPNFIPVDPLNSFRDSPASRIPRDLRLGFLPPGSLSAPTCTKSTNFRHSLTTSLFHRESCRCSHSRSLAHKPAQTSGVADPLFLCPSWKWQRAFERGRNVNIYG
jgi:hypothetical protein